MSTKVHTDPAALLVRAALRDSSPEVLKAARAVGDHLEALFRAYEAGVPIDDHMGVVAALMVAIDTTETSQ